MDTIFLLHGAGMDGSVWKPQVDALRGEGIDARAVDLPGHGGRDDGGPLPAIAAMADWLIGHLADEGAGGCVLAGHSMGALVALEAAVRAPSLVRALGMLGCAADMRVHPGLIAAAEGDSPDAPTMIARWGVNKDAEAVAAFVEDLLLGTRPGVLASDLKACDAYRDMLTSAARVDIPALVVAGGVDKMTPPAGAEPLVAALNDVTFEILPDTGHMMTLERPDAVTAALRNLVR